MALDLVVLGNRVELTWPYLVLFGLGVVFLAAQHFLAFDKRLPPGPKPHWLWGNKIPEPYSWRHFESWSKQYGPVFTVYPTGRKPLVVVNSVHAANELLEKAGNVTACVSVPLLAHKLG